MLLALMGINFTYTHSMLLYKYYTMNVNSLDSLANQGIWCHNPIHMNDPMEGLIHLRRELTSEQLAQVMEYAKGSKHDFFRNINSGLVDVNHVMHELRKKQYNKFSFGALSESFNNSLMWSHYADQHRGFVIGIDFQIDHQFVKVKYVKDLPEFDVVRWCRLFDKTEVNEEQFIHMMIEDISFKSEIWNYEKEWRVWRESPCYYYYTTPHEIKEIYLGLRFDSERYVNLMSTFMKQYPNLKIVEMEHSHFM